jgi:hypothetical protein
MKEVLHLTYAGTLNTSISPEQAKEITDLTLTGEIDARDIRFIRDEMDVLEVLDMSLASIVVYKGSKGTIKCSSMVYQAHKMPKDSFHNPQFHQSKRSLVSLSLPSNLTMIGKNAFAGCSGLTGQLILPPDMIYIGVSAFAGCKGFRGRLILPSGITLLRENVFAGCGGITGGLTIPWNVTSIHNHAFSLCLGLRSVCLPASLNSIGEEVFFKCRELREIINLNPIPIAITDKAFTQQNKLNCVLKVPAKSVSLYQEAKEWKDFTIEAITEKNN